MSILKKIIGASVATVGTVAGVGLGAVGVLTELSIEATKKAGKNVDPSLNDSVDKTMGYAKETIDKSWAKAKDLWK